ncbi:MAG: hypothetical protein HOO97_06000 [Sideroxydans sp.]|nr:hypothetical protein [Sideroxydans sp.]NOT98629.1 hypothetical protein [Sideroxydans sp.]
MLIRLAFLISALLVVISYGAFLFTRDARYARFAWQVVRFIGFVGLVFGALYLFERYGLIAWRVMV